MSKQRKTTTMTSKTARFLSVIESNPGITCAELHRRIGGDYAYGHHKFSYETVSRMLKNRLIERCTAADGLRGVGLRVPADKSVTTIAC